MKRITLPAALAFTALSLSACGYSQGDRALSGGRWPAPSLAASVAPRLAC
jgi:hypothetical protein